jgi:hypothetical protein
MSEEKPVHRVKRAGAVYTTGAGQAMREGPEIADATMTPPYDAAFDSSA